MDWIAKFFRKIYELIIGFVVWLWEVFVSFLQWWFDKLKWFIFDFGQWAWELIVEGIQAVLSFSGIDVNLQWTADFYANINYFFPLNELIAVLLFLFTTWLACFVTKIIVKAIPTVY